MNLASGNCGSVSTVRRATCLPAPRASPVRGNPGAHYHPSLTDDLEIFYDDGTLRRLVAIIRAVKPTILLTHSPQDYWKTT
jgi:LmbE family N-acetylglucosaminyl deacetylase